MKYIIINPLSFAWYMVIGGFVLFVIAMLTIGCMVPDKWKNRLISFIGFYLLIDLFFMQAYLIYYDIFLIEESLPLAFCSIMQLMSALAAIYKSNRAFEYAIFFGIIGPLQAFISPAVVYKGEEYILIDYFLAHGLTILIPIYMAFCMGFTPRKKSVYKTIIGMEVIALAVYFLNIQLDANYMYLIQKPNVIHPLNFAAWPYYLINWHMLFYIIAGCINGLFCLTNYIDRKTTGPL